MSNTVLGDININNHEKKRPARKSFSGGRDNNTPSRSTRSKIERPETERLRALYAESQTLSSVDNIHPASLSGSSAGADAPDNDPQLHQRATTRSLFRKQKENVAENSMSPESVSSSKDGDGAAAPAGEMKKLAVTPSPNPNKLSHSPDTKDGVGHPEEAPPSSESAAERASRRAAWPMADIMEPGNNDCLFGRGGGTNHHPGNKLYRKMVEDKKGKYLTSKRLDKPLVAMEIIAEWRALDPPGRFLKQDDHTKLWNDVGDKKAREKTSQALREKTPTKLREGGGGGDDHHHPHRSGGLGHQRTTRFEPGTSSPVGRHVKRPGLARDHSLGETVLGSKDINIEGFSWDDSERPVVRNADADVEGRRRAPPRHHYPAHHRHGEHYQYQGGEYHSGDYHGEHRQPHAYRREHSLSNNPLSNATVSHSAPNAFGERPPPPPPSSSYYGHHYPGYGPPPPPSHGHLHHPPPYHSHHHYPNSPENQHRTYSDNHAGYSHPPPRQQRSREHSLQMNPLKGATTSQPAREMFNDEESQASSAYDSHRPPPLPSPTYDSRGPPSVPSPYYSGGYGSPQHGWPSPPPRPQFTYHPGSNPSAFGRYDSTRSNSLRSLGSSVDAFYDRGDSSSSSSKRADSRGRHNRPAENPSSAGTPQDYSKIAELIRDSSEQTSGGVERSSSWDQGESVRRNDADYEDTIQRSKSMPYEDSSSVVAGTLAESDMAGKVKQDNAGQALSLAGVRKPSLIRKLSGGAIARNGSSPAAAPKGVLRPEPRRDVAGAIRPEPLKRDTSNQPETLETKRSIKRVVLSRDQSAVARRLKEEQVASQRSIPGPRPAMDTRASSRPMRVSRGLSKAEMLDRKLSVEVSKLGLEDINENNARGGALSRMTTEDVLTSLIDDDGLGSPSPDLMGSPVGSPLAAPPKPLGAGDRVTTIDAIAIDIASGNNIQQDNAEWDNALDLVEEPGIEPSETSESAGVNADIAEKWLKGET